MKIAIIGTGNLGCSLANGLVKDDMVKSLYLTKRNLNDLDSFKIYPQVHLTSDNLKAIENSTVIIFSLQPVHLEKVLKQTKHLYSKEHVIISTVAGVSIARIEEIIEVKDQVIRAMPNTAIAVGKSMTCMSSITNNKKAITTAQTIFDNLGTSLMIPEHQMQAATVVCASGIAFWMRLIRATTQAGVQLGFDADVAQQLAMHTAQGAAALLINKGSHPEQEIDKVTTPQGCTIEGLNEMEHKGLSSSLIQGMMASYHKINTLK